MSVLLAWFAAFVWTLALELPLYAWRLSAALEHWRRLARIVFTLNVATHPFVFALAWSFPSDVRVLALAELGAALAEGLLAARLLRGRASASTCFVASALANLVSCGAGLLWSAAASASNAG